MNVLILTPDRVGSTLLQRLITIYMLRKGFDKPVINLHELTNGLEKYFNTILNLEVLGKPKGTSWGYYQSLSVITELLQSVEHYKTSRLAHYHIQKRNDSLDEQIRFYEYLNENFFIISCQRENILEYALSWCINAHSKKLNVYSAIEKVNVFSEIYKKGITVEPTSLIKYLNAYKKYIEWCDRFFAIQSIFVYDKNINNIENYMFNLDFMKESKHNSWQDMFGQSWNDFNLCHKLLPDVRLLNNNVGNTNIEWTDPNQELQWQLYKGVDWPEFNVMSDTKLDELDTNTKQEILDLKQKSILDWNKSFIQTTANVKNFLTKHLESYKTTYKTLDQLVKDGFLVTGVPIKLQTLYEKKQIIKNFKDLVNYYNHWVDENKFGVTYTDTDLDNLIALENKSTILIEK